MTRDEMIASLNTRFSQNLARIVGNDTDEVLRILTEAQREVADEMRTAVACAEQPSLEGELDSAGNPVPRTSPANEVEDITATTEPSLPECYHPAIVAGAEIALLRRMGDGAPKAKRLPDLMLLYERALSRGHVIHARAVAAATPNRVVDGYFGTAGIFKEF